jgi:hypothetical protein
VYSCLNSLVKFVGMAIIIIFLMGGLGREGGSEGGGRGGGEGEAVVLRCFNCCLH